MGLEFLNPTRTVFFLGVFFWYKRVCFIGVCMQASAISSLDSLYLCLLLNESDSDAPFFFMVCIERKKK
jgi:hypothetical protein